MQHRSTAGHASFNPQTHVVRAAALHQLHAVLRYELLVGRHQMLARLQRGKSDGARSGENPHQLNHDVDLRVANNLLPVGSDLHGLAQPGEILFMHAARTDDLELKIASQAAPDFGLVLGQDFQGAGADRCLTQSRPGPANAPGVADGVETNSR